MRKETKLYFDKVGEMMNKIMSEESDKIERAASILAKTIQEGGLIHIFGTGHSHIFAEEAFFRAGGLACIDPMLEPSLMLHAGAAKSSLLENKPGIAEVIFDHFQPVPPDSMIVFSNSGVNSVPLQMASIAKERGIPLIGVGSKAYSQYLAERRKCKSISEYCDVFIDNKGEIGDACIEVSGLTQKIAPTSTVIGAFILNLLFVESVAKLVNESNFVPPVFVSGNLPGGKERNRELIKHYRKLVRML